MNVHSKATLILSSAVILTVTYSYHDLAYTIQIASDNYKIVLLIEPQFDFASSN